MRLLLDTHTLIWLFSGNPRLSPTALEAIQTEGARNLMSIASLWEIAIKVSLKKLHMGDNAVNRLVERATADGIARLPVEPSHCTAVAELPMHHRDPFDRMLIAQAQHEGLAIVSADPALDAYEVERIW